MKIHSQAIGPAAGLCIVALPAIASQKSDLAKKDLKKMTSAEVAPAFVGQTCKGNAFNDKGKKTASFKVAYKKDGAAAKTVTIVGKATDTKVRKWYMKGTKFCETEYRTDKLYCNHSKDFYQVKNDLYRFHKNGVIWQKMSCS